jgi:hypothetical protein
MGITSITHTVLLLVCRFHIQADFILPSSREGILEDRQWNRWLQQEVGQGRAGLFLHGAVRQANPAFLSAVGQKLPLWSLRAGSCSVS